MKQFLIDIPTMTSVWVTARSRSKALEALYNATYDCELRIQIGDDVTPVELINFTRRGEPEIIDVE